MVDEPAAMQFLGFHENSSSQCSDFKFASGVVNAGGRRLLTGAAFRRRRRKSRPSVLCK
ncbi:mlr1815 [Mesorhizobium japonicum MAFF 303099]|uniref:Mlr1815 protein n=1 Tax=Mesorhizobium japonicum (strain LMG 29417 / CECT 9101 / MAFF 303099) TaxID=266835 RepID=Q98JR7_RHILO|nr:mlr1815 [Mesorhizobium japonicum MAFF 303099]